MSLESFYGGKQGISPVIQKAFKYVDEKDPAYLAALDAGHSASSLAKETMDLCFIKSNYEEVWYGELCIIDTDNKNNPHNGELYRRTLRGAGDTGENLCAEYLGQIVGPSGGAPFISFGSIDTVNTQAHGNYVAHDTAEVAYPVSANNVSHDRPNDNVNPYIFSASNTNNMLVPGKTSSGTYNDDIKYTWFNIRNNVKNSPIDSWVYLGLKIPYPSLDIDATAIDWDLEANLTKTSTEAHPFYHSWHINIPRGARGNAASNIRLAQYKDFRNLSGTTDKDFLYDFVGSVSENSSRRGSFTISQVTPAIFRNLTSAEKTALKDSYIFVYDYIFYDKKTGSNATIQKYTFFMGLHKEIKNISLENDGSIKIQYTDNTENSFSKKIKWINDITISTTGQLTVSFNNGAASKSWQLPYPEKISLSNEGRITVAYKNGQTIPVTSEHNNEPLLLNYVNKLEIDEDSKVLSYSTYPNNKYKILNNGEGLNYIKAMIVDDKNHLLVFYGSNQKRITQEEVENGSKDGLPITDITNTAENYNRAKWNNQEFRNGIFYPNSDITQNDYWHDLGNVVKVGQGIKFTTEINYSNHPKADLVPSMSISSFIEKVLNPEYWDEEENTNLIRNPYFGGNIPGTTPDGVSLRGTVIYTPNLETGVAFYYDYDAQTWAYIGQWGSKASVDIKLTYTDGTFVDTTTDLSAEGVVFNMFDTSSHFNPKLPILW